MSIFCESIHLLLFQWTDGPPPVQIQAQNGPTTSLASLLWGTLCVTYDTSWYTITCNRSMPNNLLLEHCSLKAFWQSLDLHFISFSELFLDFLSAITFFNCYKTNTTTVVHVYLILWWHGCLQGTRTGLDWLEQWRRR